MDEGQRTRLRRIIAEMTEGGEDMDGLPSIRLALLTACVSRGATKRRS